MWPARLSYLRGQLKPFQKIVTEFLHRGLNLLHCARR